MCTSTLSDGTWNISYIMNNGADDLTSTSMIVTEGRLWHKPIDVYWEASDAVHQTPWTPAAGPGATTDPAVMGSATPSTGSPRPHINCPTRFALSAVLIWAWILHIYG
jgi:hypothetical protein